jgi:urease accessory protein
VSEGIQGQPLLRLLQLTSPSLPVGAFAYSQGLESAIELGWVNDEASLSHWLEDQLDYSIGRVDLPVFVRLHNAMVAGDYASMLTWCRQLIAMRETSELVADDCSRGRALARLLTDLGMPKADEWLSHGDTPFAALVALAAVNWNISATSALHALAWGWLENQVLVGVKLIPLGQVSGQRLLLELSAKIPGVCESAAELSDTEIGGTLPTLAIASSLHETQYTRLFRS